MAKTIFFNTNEHNKRAFSLPFDEDFKRYIFLCSKVRKQKLSRYVLGIISEIFPHCQNDEWVKWIKADARKRGMKHPEWVKDVFPERIRVKMEDFPKFSLEERAEIVHLMGKFRRTTFWHNAIEYIKGKKQADLCWTIAVQQSLDELKGYYESAAKGEIESSFYNPLIS